MASFYIAARFGRQSEMSEYAAALRLQGHTVTSRWLNASFENDEARISAWGEYAQIDIDDVIAADCFLTFTEPPGSPHNRGGRHVEYGYALATSKKCFIVGHRENVFHHLHSSNIYFYPTWGDAMQAIAEETK